MTSGTAKIAGHSQKFKIENTGWEIGTSNYTNATYSVPNILNYTEMKEKIAENDPMHFCKGCGSLFDSNKQGTLDKNFCSIDCKYSKCMLEEEESDGEKGEQII